MVCLWNYSNYVYTGVIIESSLFDWVFCNNTIIVKIFLDLYEYIPYAYVYDIEKKNVMLKSLKIRSWLEHNKKVSSGRVDFQENSGHPFCWIFFLVFFALNFSKTMFDWLRNTSWKLEKINPRIPITLPMVVILKKKKKTSHDRLQSYI